MSEPTHDTGHHHGEDELPYYPAGRIGITRGVLGLVLLTILAAIMQGAFVAAASPWGRVWPSMNSTTLTLPPANLPPSAAQ